MRYSDYKKKMNKLGKFLNVLYKLRFAIIGTVVLVTATTLTMIGISGVADGVNLEVTEIPYGTPVNAIGSAIFGSAEVQYSEYEKDNWTSEVPTYVGKYQARSVSYNGFGMATYSAPVTFDILPKPLEIEFTTNETTYGGNIKYNHNLEEGERIDNFSIIYGDNYYESNPFGENDSFVTEISFDTSSIKIYNAKEEDITACYSITSEKHNLTINKRDLHIIFEENNKTYDGNSLNNSHFKVSEETPLVEGDNFGYIDFKEIIDPGKLNITSDYQITSEKDGKTLDRTNFYNVTFNTPELTINKIDLELTTNSVSTTYNGYKFTSNVETAQEERLLTYSVSGNIHSDHEFVLESFASEGLYKPISGSKNTISYYIKDIETGEDVTEKYYNITENFGLINVNKKPLEISYLDFNEEYARQTLQGGVTSNGLVSTDELIYTLKEDNIDTLNAIGVVTYSYDFKINHLELGDVTECYDITFLDKDYGELQIKEIPLILNSNSPKKTYDAVPYSKNGEGNNLLTVTDVNNKILEGHKLVVDFANEGSIFANSTNSFTYMIIDEETNENVSYLYDITVNEGIIATDKRQVTIDYRNKEEGSDGNYNYIYDGEYKSPNYQISCPYDDEECFVGGDVLTFNNELPSIKNVGSVGDFANNHTFSITNNGVDVSNYYDVEVIDTIVKIDRRTIKIKLNNPVKDKIYDGKKTILPEDYIELYCDDGFDLESRFNFDISYSQSEFLRANEYEIEAFIQISDKEGSGSDETGVSYGENFVFEYEYENEINTFSAEEPFKIQDLEISKRPLTLSTYTAEKVYDGTSLDSEDAAIMNEGSEIWLIKEGEGLAEGDTISIIASSEITDVGTVDNIIQYDIQNEHLESVLDCYDIKPDFGNLNIKKADLNIKYTGENEFTYDNQYKSIDIDKFETTGLAEGHYIQYSSSAYRKAGIYSFRDSFSFKIFDAYGNEVTKNYNTKSFEIPSDFIINKRELVFVFKELEVDLNFSFTSNVYSCIDSSSSILSCGYNEYYDISWGDSAACKEAVKNNKFPPVNIKIYDNELVEGQRVDNTDNYDISIISNGTKRGITSINIRIRDTRTFCMDKEVDVSSYYYAEPSLPSGYYFSDLEYDRPNGLINPGTYKINAKNTDQIKIYNAEGDDVTSFFKFLSIDNEFEVIITQFEIKVSQQQFTYNYSGEPNNIKADYNSQAELDYRGHHLEVVGWEAPKDPGNYVFTIDGPEDLCVKTALGEDVTHLYKIDVSSLVDNGEGGTSSADINIYINKIKINLETSSVTKTFDGKPLDEETIIKARSILSISSGSDAPHYELISSKTYSTKIGDFDICINNTAATSVDLTNYHVFKETQGNTADIKISRDGQELTQEEINKYFEIETNFGDLSITPLVISYETVDSSRQYNGLEVISEEDLLEGGQHLIKVNLNSLPKEILEKIETFSVYLDLGDNTFLAGTYVGTPTFSLIVDGEDLILKGDIIMSGGSVEQTVTQITLSIQNIGGEYIIHKRSDDPTEELYVSGLIAGDILYVGGQQYEQGIVDYSAIANMRPAEKGTYIYTASHISGVAFTIQRNVNGNIIDVTSCYNIEIHWSDVKVTLN